METKGTRQDSQIKTIISDTIKKELKIINGELPKHEVDPRKLWICEDDEEDDKNKRRKKRKIPKPPNPNIGVRNLLLHIHNTTSSTCCIRADSGAGRSILAQYLTHAWSSGEEITGLKEFEAVFLVSARNIVDALNSISEIKCAEKEPKDESVCKAEDLLNDTNTCDLSKQVTESDCGREKDEKQESQVNKAWNGLLCKLLPMSTGIHGPEIVSECLLQMETLLIIDDAEDLHECTMESVHDIYKSACELNITIILLTDLRGYKRISQIWEPEKVVKIELLGLGRSDIVTEAKSYTDRRKSGLSADLRDLPSNGEVIPDTNDSQMDVGNCTDQNESLDTPKQSDSKQQAESNIQDDLNAKDHKTEITKSQNDELDTGAEGKGNESTASTAANPKTFLNILSGRTKVKKSERRTYYEVCGPPKNVVEFISRNICRLEKLLRFPEMLIRTCDMYLDSPDLFDGVTTSTDLLWTLIHWEGHCAFSLSNSSEDYQHFTDTPNSSHLLNESGEVNSEQCTSMPNENTVNDSDSSSSDQKSKRHSKSRLSCDFSEFVHKCSKSSKNNKEPDKNFHENIYNWLLYLGEKCLGVLMNNERMEGEYLQQLKVNTVKTFGDEVGESFFNRVFKVRDFFPLSSIPDEVNIFVAEHLRENLNASKLKNEMSGNETVMSDNISVNVKSNSDNCVDLDFDSTHELSKTSEIKTDMNTEISDKSDSVIAQSPNLNRLKVEGFENTDEKLFNQHSTINSGKSNGFLGESFTHENIDNFGGQINKINNISQDLNHTNDNKSSILHENKDTKNPDGDRNVNDNCKCLESDVLEITTEGREHKGLMMMDSLEGGPIPSDSVTTNDQRLNIKEETSGSLQPSQNSDKNNVNERKMESINYNDSEKDNLRNESKEEIQLLQNGKFVENGGASGNEINTSELVNGNIKMESESFVNQENIRSDIKDVNDSVEDFWGNILESKSNEQMKNCGLGNDDINKNESVEENVKFENFGENKNTVSDIEDINDSANEDFWGNILGPENNDPQVKNDDLCQKLTGEDVSHDGKDETTEVSKPNSSENKCNEEKDQPNSLSNSTENHISYSEKCNGTPQTINVQNSLTEDSNSENLCIKSLDSVSEIGMTNGHKIYENNCCEISDCSLQYSDDNHESPCNGLVKSIEVTDENTASVSEDCARSSKDISIPEEEVQLREESKESSSVTINNNDLDNNNLWGNVNETLTSSNHIEHTEGQSNSQDERRNEDLQNNFTEQTSVDCENISVMNDTSKISEDQECENFNNTSTVNERKEVDKTLVVEKQQKGEKVEEVQQQRKQQQQKKEDKQQKQKQQKQEHQHQQQGQKQQKQEKENEQQNQQQEQNQQKQEQQHQQQKQGKEDKQKTQQQEQKQQKQEEWQEQQQDGGESRLDNDKTAGESSITSDIKNNHLNNEQDLQDHVEFQSRVENIINDLKNLIPSSSSSVLSTRNPLMIEFLASWFLIHEIQSGRSFASLTSGSRHSLRQLCIFGAGLVNRIRKIVGYNRDLNRQRLISSLVNYRSDSSYELSFNMDMVTEFKSSPDLLSFIVEASEYPDEWHISLYDTQIVPLQALLLNVSPSRIFLNVEECRPFSEEKYILEFVPRVEILVWLDSGCQFTYGHKDRMDKVVKSFTAPVVLARVELVSGCLTHTGLLDLSPHVAFEKLRYLKLRVLDMTSLSYLLLIDRQIKSLLWLEVKLDFDWISEDEANINSLPRSSVPLFDVYFQGCSDEDVVRISTIMSLMHNRYSGIHLESTSLTPEGVYVLLKQLQRKKICLHSHPTARQKFRRWYYPQFANQPTLSDDQARERLGYDDRIFYSNHFVQSSTYATAIDAWNLTSFLEEEEKIVHFVYSTENIKFVKRLTGQVEMERITVT